MYGFILFDRYFSFLIIVKDGSVVYRSASLF